MSDLKPYLKSRFQVYHGVVDLYAYFFERGLRLLKQGGRLGYISSSTFFKTGSGAPLRDYLRQNAAIESIVDFGDHQIFEGVTTYPVIITMRADAPNADHALQFWTIDDLPSENFGKAYAAHRQPYPQQALTSGSWELESPALQALRHKIISGKKTLKEVYGEPFRGVTTGRNEAFVINRKIFDTLTKNNPNSIEILKPYLEGRSMRRWYQKDSQLYIIFSSRGIDIQKYPAILDYLQKQKEQLKPKPKSWKPKDAADKWQGRKPGSYAWYEIQDVVAYSANFERDKIVYLDIASKNPFSMDTSKSYLANTAYGIDSSEWWLLGFLNSKLFWFFFSSLSPEIRGGFSRLIRQNVIQTPIPDATPEQKAALAALAQAAQAAAEKRYALQQSITRRIPDLAADPSTAKLSNKLKSWWDLPDFAAFQKEVKKTLKSEIPLKERNEWDNWIAETRTDIHALSAQITQIEADINTQAYALFGLTADEITLLEANI